MTYDDRIIGYNGMKWLGDGVIIFLGRYVHVFFNGIGEFQGKDYI